VRAETVRSTLLSGVAGVRHGFFTRHGGVSEGVYASLNGGQGSDDDPARVSENRARIAAELQASPGNLVSVHQIHSSKVVTVEAPWGREARPKADAMVTAQPGLALAILSADCGPILFAEPHSRVIGAAHAGWKGAVGGVIEASIQAMEALGAARGRIIACLGMTISGKNYEVGPEFVARFEAEAPENRHFFSDFKVDGHAMFDLPAYIVMRLSSAGIGEVEDLRLCTYADEARFYSYRRATHRREAEYGRHISGIVLADQG
jgi:YfiH family protein